MRFLLIISIIFFSIPLEAKLMEKCEDSYNSYETNKCLKILKGKLINYNLSLTIFTPNKNLYKSKNIYVSICKKNLTSHKYSGENGEIDIKFKAKDIKYCESLINIDIISEYGLCTNGKYAVTNWNSLKMENILYLSCSD